MDRIISQRFQQASNDLIAERVVALADGDRLRARVRRNFYDTQSEAGVDVWTSVGWSRAITLPIVDLEVSQHSATTRGDVWKEHAANDLDLLEDIGRDFLTSPVRPPPTLVDKVQAVRARRRLVDQYLEGGMSLQESEALADKVISFAEAERRGMSTDR